MLRGQGRTHPGYDALPMQGQSHPPTLRLGQWRHASSPYVDIFGMWEKTGVLKKKKKKTDVDMGEHINSTQWPS